MTVLGLPNFSATKTICEKGEILSHLDFSVLHEENVGKVSSWHVGLGWDTLCSFSSH